MVKTVAVIFGSRSAEHDVSIVTAIAAIIKPLQFLPGYKPLPVYIAKDGSWYSDPRLADIKTYTSTGLEQLLKKLKPLTFTFDGGLTLSSGNLKKKLTRIDLVFPATHGTYGEDGALMGLLEMANVPYVGCDLAASAVAMNKVLSKQVAQAAGIPIVPFVSFTKAEFANSENEIMQRIKRELTFPLFIKPAHLGSSIGINRAKDEFELHNAIEVAAHYDELILVENGVQNLIEVTLPVLGNDELTPALLERPLTNGDELFDFETKYMNQGKGGGKKVAGAKQGSQGYSEVPAKLDTKLYQEAETIGLNTYRALGCCGTARIDMLINSQTNQIFFNEANPLPGSLYAHNWRAAGISNVALVERLVKLAQERYEAKQKLNTTFSTNFLQQF